MESRSIFSPPRAAANGDLRNSMSREAPACVQNAMFSKEKKPFTYTPGGIDLSQIKSEKMAKRLMRNAMSPGVQERPKAPNFTPAVDPSAPKSCHYYNMPVAVFPCIQIPANPKELLRRTSGPYSRSESMEPSTPTTPVVIDNRINGKFPDYESKAKPVEIAKKLEEVSLVPVEKKCKNINSSKEVAPMVVGNGVEKLTNGGHCMQEENIDNSTSYIVEPKCIIKPTEDVIQCSLEIKKINKDAPTVTKEVSEPLKEEKKSIKEENKIINENIKTAREEPKAEKVPDVPKEVPIKINEVLEERVESVQYSNTKPCVDLVENKSESEECVSIPMKNIPDISLEPEIEQHNISLRETPQIKPEVPKYTKEITPEPIRDSPKPLRETPVASREVASPMFRKEIVPDTIRDSPKPLRETPVITREVPMFRKEITPEPIRYSPKPLRETPIITREIPMFRKEITPEPMRNSSTPLRETPIVPLFSKEITPEPIRNSPKTIKDVSEAMKDFSKLIKDVSDSIKNNPKSMNIVSDTIKDVSKIIKHVPEPIKQEPPISAETSASILNPLLEILESEIEKCVGESKLAPSEKFTEPLYRKDERFENYSPRENGIEGANEGLRVARRDESRSPADEEGRVISPMRRSAETIKDLTNDLDNMPTLNICPKRFSFLRDSPDKDDYAREDDDPFRILTGIPPKISLIDRPKPDYQNYDKQQQQQQPPWKADKDKPIENKADRLSAPWKDDLRAPSPFSKEDSFWKKDWNSLSRKDSLTMKDILKEDPEPAWKKEIREIALRKAKEETKEYTNSLQPMRAPSIVKETEYPINNSAPYQPPWDVPNNNYYKPMEAPEKPAPVQYTPTWSQTLRPKSWKEREAERLRENEFANQPKKSVTNNFLRNNQETMMRKTPEITVEVVNQPTTYTSNTLPSNTSSYIYPWESSSESSTAFSPEPRTPTPQSRNSPFTLSPNYPNGGYAQTASPREYATLGFQPKRRTPGRSCPIQSRSFKYLQLLTGTEDNFEDDEPFIPQPAQHAYPRPGNF